MKKGFHIYCETYLENIYFCPGFTQSELKEFVDNQFEIDFQIDVSGKHGMATMVSSEACGGVIIWLEKGSLTPKDISFLVHECLHAVNMILSHRGVVGSYDDDEVQAYLLGWVVKKCLESYKK